MVAGDFVGAASTVCLAAVAGTSSAGQARPGPLGAAMVGWTDKPVGMTAVPVAARGPRPDGSLLIAASRRLARRPVGMVRQPRFGDEVNGFTTDVSDALGG
jgi:hypothetical protein